MLDDATIQQLVGPIIRTALASDAIKSMEIKSERDHDGEPIIRLTIVHEENAPKLDAKAFLDSANTAMSELHRRGEERFLHIRNVYSDGEPALDDQSPASQPRRRRRA